MSRSTHGEISFSYYSDTNSIGPSHEENQDSVFVSKNALVFAIADGVGGYVGGKVASEIAIDVIRDRLFDLNTGESLSSCLAAIDTRIKERAKSLHYYGMGSTVALAKIIPENSASDRSEDEEEGTRDGGEIITANVGDSPIFLIPRDSQNDKKVALLYSDDSERFSDPYNMWTINQYLGYTEGELNVHVKSTRYRNGDIMLLCSDGISDNILGVRNDLEELGSLVREQPDAKELVSFAIRKGRKADDMSAIVVLL